MKKTVKIEFEAKVEEPKIGEQFCANGLFGKAGHSCEEIVKITKNYIYVGNRYQKQRIRIKDYYFDKVMNSSKRKIKMGID